MFLEEQRCLKLCVIATFSYESNLSASNNKVVGFFKTILITGCKPM
jgi:hypothetical protein